MKLIKVMGQYGKLYNWYAVNDPKGLAPKGWHVPSDNEWVQLIDYLGGDYVAGTEMKSTSGWEENGNGNNNSGFSGFPSGHCNFLGSFKNIGSYGYWWSSTEFNNTHSICVCMGYNVSFVNRGIIYKDSGFSVRCLRD